MARYDLTNNRNVQKRSQWSWIRLQRTYYGLWLGLTLTLILAVNLILTRTYSRSVQLQRNRWTGILFCCGPLLSLPSPL